MSQGNYIPTKGERIQQAVNGTRRTGVVWYADQLQILVEWEDGRSSSLRIGRARFWIIEGGKQPEWVERGRSKRAVDVPTRTGGLLGPGPSASATGTIR